MEEKTHNSQLLNNSKVYNSPTSIRVKNYSKINVSDDKKINFTQKNISNKLNHAFSDLDSLRKALKTIKYKNENTIIEGTKKFINKSNRSRYISPKKDNYVSSVNNSYSRDYNMNGGSKSRSNSNDKFNRNRSYLKNKADRYDYYRTPRGNFYIN